jgi:hypothetical protein
MKGINSNIAIGVGAPSLFENNTKKLPGEVPNTIGYHSKCGLMFYNGKSNGNMMGKKCEKGDNIYTYF